MISGTGFLAVAAREAYAKATADAQIVTQMEVKKNALKIAKKTRLEVQTLTVMRSWLTGLSLETVTNLVDFPPSKIADLVASFEKVKTYRHSKNKINMKELKQLSGLTETDIKTLLVLLERQA
jgi:hypothetical protein